MKYIIVLTLFLTGCSTVVPVTQPFPAAPQELQQPCEPLTTASTTSSLSEFAKVVVQNYGKYHSCAATVSGWQEWYSTQKQLFEELK